MKHRLLPLTLLRNAMAICWMACLLGGLSPAQAQLLPSALVIGRLDSLQSQILHENRKLWVYVPDHKAGQRISVIYLLDGEANFHSVVGIVKQLSEVSQFSPPMMVVGISNTDRMRDFTPTHIASPREDSVFLKTSGGGENFTAFLEKELIPYVDRHYPTSPKRMLIGHSLGGLLVLNALMKHTHLFNHYVCIDPTTTWDNQRWLKDYLAVLPTKQFSNQRFFLSAANFASLDSLSIRRDTTRLTQPTRSIFALADALKKKADPGLTWACRYYPDETHHSVPLISEYEAIKFFFAHRPVRLTAQQLKACEGKYAIEIEKEQLVLQVRVEKGQLVAKQLWDGSEMWLTPESEADFYCKLNPYPTTFVKDKTGRVRQVVLFHADVLERIQE